jgi:hypothetical protein
MKRQTKQDKFRDLANAVKQIREGKAVKRIGAKDGSIPTHPVVPVDPDLSEKEVQTACLHWLFKHGIYAKRCDSGSFRNDRNQWGTYGIVGSGDIHCILRNHNGKHLEIECKRGKGGRQSKQQQKRQRDVEYNNGVYLIIHGLPELIFLMEEWL